VLEVGCWVLRDKIGIITHLINPKSEICNPWPRPFVQQNFNPVSL
jgi:hypothetical protein